MECAETTGFVPAGLSGWELSVNRSVNRKAECDYANRLGKIPQQKRARWTYVGVICRPWRDASKFARAKSELGEFREVRSLNVDDVEAWLEQAPQTTVWLRELLGRPVDGVRTVSSWWSTSWLGSTTVPLDGEIVLAGRVQQVEDFRRACETQEVVTIGGDVRRDEILAFVAAALLEPSGSKLASRGEVLYVDDPVAADRLLGSPGGVTVVLRSENLFHRLQMAGGSDRVIVPLPGEEQVDVVLPAIDPRTVAERLQALGERHRVALDLGALARRSLLAVRRHYARQPGLFRPSWVRDGARKALRRGLLLNRWNHTQLSDRQIVERFVGRPYETVEEELNQFAAHGGDDPPFALVGKQWHVVSAADTWDIVGSQITADDIAAFAEAAEEVLTDPDPLSSMSTGERLRAMMGGVGPRYSSDLVRGIATTLAIVGSSGKHIDRASTTGTDVAETIVWKLVEAANADSSFGTWATLAPSLPLLAEAAPDALLNGFRHGLSVNPPLLAAMFHPEPSEPFGLDGPEPCVYFLSTLELLAWSSNHLGAVVTILGKLSELDPRGPGRAVESLTRIMFPVRPNTAASAESRLGAIRRLRKVSEPAAWHLMISMLPTSHMTSVRHPGPRYRNWEQGAAGVTHNEFASLTRSIMATLVEDAGQDPARWSTLIDRVGHLPINAGLDLVQDLTEDVARGLSRFVETGADDTARSDIWSAMRDMVARHREFSYMPWAFPERVLSLLDPLKEQITPQDRNVKYGWLFTNEHIDFGDSSSREGLDAYDRALLEQRVEAVVTIIEVGGWEALIDFTN